MLRQKRTCRCSIVPLVLGVRHVTLRFRWTSLDILRSIPQGYMHFSARTMAAKGFAVSGRSRQNQAISDMENVKIVDSLKPCTICQEVRLSLPRACSFFLGYKYRDTLVHFPCPLASGATFNVRFVRSARDPRERSAIS